MTILIIPNISCSHCARTVTDVILALDPAARVEVDVARQTVELNSTADLNVIGARLAANGYPPKNVP